MCVCYSIETRVMPVADCCVCLSNEVCECDCVHNMLSRNTASIYNEKLPNSTALNEKFLGTEKDLTNQDCTNFFEEIASCKYLETNELSTICRSDDQQSTFFSININIRSLVNKHFSSLESFLSSLDVLPQVIGINETWEKLLHTCLQITCQ